MVVLPVDSSVVNLPAAAPAVTAGVAFGSAARVPIAMPSILPEPPESVGSLIVGAVNVLLVRV